LLLECIFGLGLFGMAFLVVMGVFGSIARTNSQSRQYSMAHQLARSVLEAEIHKPYGSVVNVAPTLVPQSFEANGNVGTLEFTAEFRVFAPDIEPGRCKHVAAVVSWEDGNTPRQVVLDTYVSSP